MLCHSSCLSYDLSNFLSLGLGFLMCAVGENHSRNCKKFLLRNMAVGHGLRPTQMGNYEVPSPLWFLVASA